jgi:hypothetical protein
VRVEFIGAALAKGQKLSLNIYSWKAFSGVLKFADEARANTSGAPCTPAYPLGLFILIHNVEGRLSRSCFGAEQIFVNSLVA